MQPMKPYKLPDIVSYDASVASALAFPDGVTAVRLVATTNCHILFGSSPTATTSHTYLPAGVVEYFRVAPGLKVAAIKASGGTAGLLNVTWMTQ